MCPHSSSPPPLLIHACATHSGLLTAGGGLAAWREGRTSESDGYQEMVDTIAKGIKAVATESKKALVLDDQDATAEAGQEETWAFNDQWGLQWGVCSFHTSATLPQFHRRHPSFPSQTCARHLQALVSVQSTPQRSNHSQPTKTFVCFHHCTPVEAGLDHDDGAQDARQAAEKLRADEISLAQWDKESAEREVHKAREVQHALTQQVKCVLYPGIG